MTGSQKKNVWLSILLYVAIVGAICSIFTLLTVFIENVKGNIGYYVLNFGFSILAAILSLVAIKKRKEKSLGNGLIITICVMIIIPFVVSYIANIFNVFSLIPFLQNNTDSGLINIILKNVSNLIFGPVLLIVPIFNFVYLKQELVIENKFDKKLCWYGITLYILFNVCIRIFDEFLSIAHCLKQGYFGYILVLAFIGLIVIDILIIVYLAKGLKPYLNKDLSIVEKSIPVLLIINAGIIGLINVVYVYETLFVLAKSMENKQSYIFFTDQLMSFLTELVCTFGVRLFIAIKCFTQKKIKEVTNTEIKDLEF